MIRFGTYNYNNRINSGLESALSVMDQDNLDLWLFQETKFMDRIHIGELEGQCVLTTEKLIWHCRGASIL